MSDLASLSVEEIFQLLESNNPDVVSEIQRLFHENLSETREGWLVSGLYDYYTNTGSANGLKLLLNVKEPHDRLLCDRLAEGLRSSDKVRTIALDMLGYIVRKQPTWLHKIAQHQLIKDLMRLLKTETDVVVLVPSLLVMVSLLPAVSANLSKFLSELFEIFSRLCIYKWRDASTLSDLSCTHLTVALYAYFQRLYGMFPCNFLSYMRQQYLDNSVSTGSSVFTDIISPLLATVRLHPLLVTQNREHEKTPIRWKGLAEVHDVVAECSRYSLDVYESASREDLGLLSLWPVAGDHTPLLTPGAGLARNTNWSPGVNPTNLNTVLSPKQGEKRSRPSLNTKLVLDSPPEAAVEATPDNTPYATPVKDSPLRHNSKHGPAPHIKSLSFKSPGPASPTKCMTSPTKESSPFRFPDPSERRDSLFAEVPSSALSKRDSLGLGMPNLSSLSTRMRTIASDRAELESACDPTVDTRPSPVKFTAQPQLQASPLKPSAENPGGRYNMDRAKLLSLPLDTGDPTREEMDAEVSSITGSVVEKMHLSTRHITPHIFPDSAGGSSCTSRAMSRLSVGSPRDDQEADTVSALSASGTPSSFQPSVDELVMKVRTRVRCITLCEPSDPPTPTTISKRSISRKLSRSSSCPNIAEIAAEDLDITNSNTNKREKSKLRFTSGTQTDADLAILPYEHLFPFALPLNTSTVSASPPIPPPQELLDTYIQAAVSSNNNQKDLKFQLEMLRSQLQFETGRREVLGARNRRLLGFTKNVRELEEQNLALVDQLHMVQQEIATLHTQLAKVRNGKHQAETERAECGKLQDKMIQDLQAKVQELTTSNREVTERFELKEMTSLEALAACDKARSELFQAQAKLDIFRKKEENWKTCESELTNSRKRLVLQGELIERQKERLEMIPRAGKEEEIRLVQQAALHEVATAKADLLHKSQERTAASARIAELEARNAALEDGFTNQKEMIQSIHEEHKERLGAVETRHKAIRSVNIHLESTIMELQERIERMLKHRGKRAGASPSTDSIDMMTMSNMSNSLVGSLGSDTGEHIRRAMDSPPVNIGREIMGLEIPVSAGRSVGVESAYSVGVGSAHSVLHREWLGSSGGAPGQEGGGANGHSH